ncbi:hypothetical protein BGW38_003682 [Lunasporangiospora selenospora]|uniref:Uncharacterized protein n=1 Tax=Lunasporangiospora selenospora TaxID=979761 RepID=A0A9P6KC13_9FUNG|nr:hypothetical protein BGW38_003682 [Lunasporangiospora selenospora]
MTPAHQLSDPLPQHETQSINADPQPDSPVGDQQSAQAIKTDTLSDVLQQASQAIKNGQQPIESLGDVLDQVTQTIGDAIQQATQAIKTKQHTQETLGDILHLGDTLHQATQTICDLIDQVVRDIDAKQQAAQALDDAQQVGPTAIDVSGESLYMRFTNLHLRHMEHLETEMSNMAQRRHRKGLFLVLTVEGMILAASLVQHAKFGATGSALLTIPAAVADESGPPSTNLLSAVSKRLNTSAEVTVSRSQMGIVGIEIKLNLTGRELGLRDDPSQDTSAEGLLPLLDDSPYQNHKLD